jgi:predicted kinase
MLTLFMLKGLPASGKTTWARKYQETLGKGKVTRVNKDDLRAMLHNGEWSNHNEKEVLAVRDFVVTNALSRGQHVIVDDTNLDPKHERDLRELAEKANANFEVVAFVQVDERSVYDTYQLCLERNRKRYSFPPSHTSVVPDGVIHEMYEKYLRPAPPKVDYNESLSDCIIVDIDGTLAIRNGRSPFDWARVGEDLPNTPIVDLVWQFIWETDDDVIFVSGRDAVCREETMKWLVSHFETPFLTLHMRPEGDTRDDRIVKKEIYEREIKGKYNVRFVLDDRDKVVRMWRDLGLTCLQVAEGNF